MSSDSATAGENYGMDKTSGHKQPVWIATEPYSCRPTFPKLDRNITTDVVVVGAGITGISAAYECVGRGMNTTLIDAREVLSGETGRTSGHLGSALDDRYYELIKSKARTNRSGGVFFPRRTATNRFVCVSPLQHSAKTALGRRSIPTSTHSSVSAKLLRRRGSSASIASFLAT